MLGSRMPLVKLAYAKRENSFTLKPRESATVLLHSVQRFFSEKKLTDAKLVYHEKELFSCHKAVLSAFSSYFETLLTGTENCTVLSLDAVNPDNVDDLKFILQYMYGHNVSVPRNRVQHLLESAKIFGVTALHKTLEAQLVREVTQTFLDPPSVGGVAGRKKSAAKSYSSNVVVIKPTAVASILLVSFQRFKAEQKFLDAKIFAADMQLHTAHKIVLAAYSRYFESLLEATETLAILNLDAVESVHVDHLKEILLYMYGHQVDIKESQVDSLISAAGIFGVTSLRDGELSRISLKLQGGANRMLSHSSNTPIYYQPPPMFADSKEGTKEMSDRPVRSDYSFARIEPSPTSPCETSVAIPITLAAKDVAKPLVITSPSLLTPSKCLTTPNSVSMGSRDGLFSMSSPSFSLSSGIDESVTMPNVSDSFVMEEVIGDDSCNLAVDASNGLYSNEHVLATDLIGREVYISDVPESSLQNQQCLSGLLKEETIDDQLDYPVFSRNQSLLSAESNNLDFEIDPFVEAGVLIDYRPCPLCGRAIKDGNIKALMQSHLRQHHRQPVFTAGADSQGTSRGSGAKKLSWLSCTDCEKLFKTARTLLRHSKMCHHDARDKLSCISCQLVFRTDSALQAHTRTSHKRLPQTGSQSVPSLLMEFGLDAHSGTVFSPEDGESVVTGTPSGLVSPATRDSHDVSNGGEYLSEEGNSAMDEECCYSSEQGELLNEVCASTAASVSGANRKPKRNAIGVNSSVPKKRLPKVYMVSPIVDRNPVANCPELSNHVCDRCEPKISFAGKAEFLSHCEKEHNLEIHKCTKCKKMFKTSVGLRQHYDSHRNTVLMCIKCGFETKSRSNLSLHLRKEHKVTITGAKMKPRFQCAVCGQKFVYECLLNNHVRSKHSAEKPFKCPFCEYGATEKGALKTHIRSIHAKEKPFKCPVCDLAFTTSSILARHRRTHTGELPHKCSICDERFSEKRNLTAHHLKIHERSRPFKCDRCTMAFFRKDFLGAHMKRHGVLPY